METWKRALALAPALVAAAGCANLGEWTRDSVGLDQDPVRTEYDDGAPDPETLAHAGFRAREALICSIDAMVNKSTILDDHPRMCRARSSNQQATSVQQTDAEKVIARAEEYYHIGRLALRSQCESYMQTLASVDGQTTFGRDLANNFFDTATVAATVAQSPPIWATGLSATQNSFNSVSGSTERFLLLTDSVGALRERVLARMAAEEGAQLDFSVYQGQALTNAVALDVARRSLLAVQRYGAPCTEAGIRLIISEALATTGIAEQAQLSRYQSYVQVIQGIINEGVQKDDQHDVDDAELRVLYLWAITAASAASTDAWKVHAQIEQVRLPYLARVTNGDLRSRLSYYVQQAATQNAVVRNDIEVLRAELLAAYQSRNAEQDQESH